MSPDLSLIENLWYELKSAIREKKPENIQELEQFAKKNWGLPVSHGQCAGLKSPAGGRRVKHSEALFHLIVPYYTVFHQFHTAVRGPTAVRCEEVSTYTQANMNRSRHVVLK